MKSASTADDWRKKGNELFQKKDYSGALQFYTKSVQHAPHGDEDEGDILALAHANRSAALYHLEEHKACMQDIEEAISNGYPADRRYKVLQRKGQCFIKLGQYSKAKAEFENALASLKSDAADIEKRKSELKSLIDQCERALKKLDFEPPDQTLLDDAPNDVINDKSPVLINASAAVSLQCNEPKGRFLVAGRNIVAGELLIREKPFAAVPFKDEKDSYCHHCFTPCLALIPCPDCIDGQYCSAECRTEAWELYHQSECGFHEQLQQISEFSHLGLRILLAAGRETLSSHLTRIIDLISKTGDKAMLPVALLTSEVAVASSSSSSQPLSAPEGASTSASASSSSSAAVAPSSSETAASSSSSLAKQSVPETEADELSSEDLRVHRGCSKDGRYHGDYESILHLQEHSDTHSEEELGQYAETSTSLAKLFHRKLVIPETLETMSESKLIEKLAFLLLFHTEQMKTNTHAITVVKPSDLRKPTEKSMGGSVVQELTQTRVATAVYPTASLMNHACQPNVIVGYHQGEIFVRATQDIPVGDEILHCYGPHANHMSTPERQKALQDQYCFTCDCTACSQPSQPPSQKNDACFRCPKCGGPIGDAAKLGCETNTCNCKSCGQEVDLKETREEGERIVTLLNRLNEVLASSGDNATIITEVISKARSCVDALERILVSPHMHLAVAYDFMAKCHAAISQYPEAAAWLSKSIPSLEDQYGSDSIEVAHEVFKLAQLHFNGKEAKAALEVIGRALKMFVRHYGNKSQEVKELLYMKACLIFSE